MKKKLLLTLILSPLLLLSSLFFFRHSPSPSPHRYQLTICAFFKNEAPWLKEWLTYHHRVLGFEHFYLYNNDSSDNYQEILQPFIEQGIVELIDWSSSDESHSLGNDEKWLRFQVGAYNHCLKTKALGQAKWVAFIDIDEFIAPVHGAAAFHRFIRSLDKKKVGNVKLSWRMFGTSDVWDLAPHESLLEKMVFRAADEHPSHRLFKAMHRPEAIPFCHIHDAPKMQHHFRRLHVDPNELRLHHYWTRTGKVCAEKRGLKKPENKDVLDGFQSFEDRTMEQYLPALKACL